MWLVEMSKFIIEWGDPKIQSYYREHHQLPIDSCKSGCKTNRCGYKKKDSYCGPGYECHECNNLPLKQVEDVMTKRSLSVTVMKMVAVVLVMKR